MLYRSLICCIGALFFLFACPSVEAAEYDPLEKTHEVKQFDLTVEDEKRDREIPIRIYLPKEVRAAPVVLFSHGLGGSRKGSIYLGNHWAGRGYVAVFLQHPGSDESVWKDTPLLQRMAALQKAASGQNFLLRVQDVPAVLDQLAAWNKSSDHSLAGRLDMQRVGMSGHSFGAVTTQAVSGQTDVFGRQRFTDERIDAAIAFSPSTPRRGTPEQGFGSVKIPWLLMTGTKDTAAIGGQTVETRQQVYPALPKTIDKYQLVLYKAEHSAFTDRALRGDTEPRNPNHHRVILALSTAFWDTYLNKNSAAQEWLQGKSAKELLESEDSWEVNVAKSE